MHQEGKTTSLSLLSGLRCGDDSAWRQTAIIYAPLVQDWCRRAGIQASDSDDIVQEVFLTVAKKVQGFRRMPQVGSFRGWLWQISRNKVGDYLRRKQRGPNPIGGSDGRHRFDQLPDLADQSDSGHSYPADGFTSACKRALDLIQGDFKTSSWQAFWGVAVDGKPAEQVADELGLSRGAVYIAKSRILRRLRECLGDTDVVTPSNQPGFAEDVE